MIPSPDPDTYGQYARASLLADYAELLVLNRQPVRHATLADFLADNIRSWDLELMQSAQLHSPDEQPEGMSEHIDEARRRATIVFEQIVERRDMLGCLYPFLVTSDHSEVVLRDNLDLESNAYVSILMLTVAHAFKLESPHSLEHLFEEVVTKTLGVRGLRSTGLAAHRRKSGSFPEALKIACQEVGLKAAPDAAPVLAHAHDEGVDVLCHFGWEEDLRPSTWAFIGQATVGKSDTWENKLGEPRPKPWADRMGTWTLPLPFLAVPHHIERPMMERLAKSGEALVLDRLRLAKFRGEIGDEEREVIRAVAEREVEPLAG